MRPLALHIGLDGDFLRTSGRFWATSLGRPRDVNLQSGYGAAFLKKIRRKSCSANQWTGFYMIGTSIMKE